RRHTRSDRDWSSDVCSSDLIVIFANWLVRLRLSRGPYTALADLHVATLVACLQRAVEPEFHTQPLAAHASLHLGARNLVATAGRSEERRVGKECRVRRVWSP